MDGSSESYTRAYPAVAESVPRARADLTAFVHQAGVSDDRADGIRLAASEAITNAVIHAYPPGGVGAGTIQVCASLVEDGLWVLVADEGDGLRRRAPNRKGLGLGLVLIAQLTDDFELVRRGGGGTELRMRFRLPTGHRESKPQDRGSLSTAAVPA